MLSRRDQEGPRDFCDPLFFFYPHPTIPLALLVLVDSTSRSVVSSTSTLLWPSPHFHHFSTSWGSRPFVSSPSLPWSLLNLPPCDGESFAFWLSLLPSSSCVLGPNHHNLTCTSFSWHISQRASKQTREVTDLLVYVPSTLLCADGLELSVWLVLRPVGKL